MRFFMGEEAGQGMLEYALILVACSIVAVAILTHIGGFPVTKIQDAANALS